MKKQSGFTLIEWMIALTIGLFLFAGMMSLYSISHETTNDSLDSGELQENGRIAMNLLLKDLRMVGFWGDYTGSILDEDTAEPIHWQMEATDGQTITRNARLPRVIFLR